MDTDNNMAQVKNLPAMQEMQETQVQFLGWEDCLEEGMATHSSILAWRIPWTEEPGRLQPTGSQESDMTEENELTSTQNHIMCLSEKCNY